MAFLADLSVVVFSEVFAINNQGNEVIEFNI